MLKAGIKKFDGSSKLNTGLASKTSEEIETFGELFLGFEVAW